MRAALAMLGQAIEQCPIDRWTGPQRHPVWRVCYHALFFTDLYTGVDPSALSPWPGHRERVHDLGQPDAGAPYAQAEVLAYQRHLSEELPQRIPLVPFAASSGFHWLHMSRLELHLYNLRHLQHHTGQVADRLPEGVGWVFQA